jgi:hypothetical protein
MLPIMPISNMSGMYDVLNSVCISTMMYTFLDVIDVCKLDSATLSKAHRDLFLYAASGAALIPGQQLTTVQSTTVLDYYAFYRWVAKRRVQIGFKLYLPGAYSYLMKRVPTLLNVVGSSVTQARFPSSVLLGGVHNFTANSILRILTAMKLPEFGRGVKFLEAGCRNCIFAVLIKMLYPHALVFAVDLQSIVNTLDVIQTHTDYAPMMNLPIQVVDIRTIEFLNHVKTLRPTHATCLIGLKSEERAFLRSAELAGSVRSVAVLQKTKGGKTKFSPFKFEKTATLSTHYATSGEAKTVLVAKRK